MVDFGGTATIFDVVNAAGEKIAIRTSVAEAGNVRLRTTVDGTVCQESSTSEMIRSVSELVSEISSRLTLLPGDVILTGTPAGAATVVPRQQVEVEIEGIGTLVNSVVAGQNAVVEG